MDITFTIKSFDQLRVNELYEILRLRAEVFVVEQDCVYQDIDNKDQTALHVIGTKNKKIIAYTRILDQGVYFEQAAIGRVVVEQAQRQFGYGHDLIKMSIAGIYERFGTKSIKISAQKHLENFYEQHGFVTKGKEYLEDGIPHIAMLKEILNRSKDVNV